MAFEVVRARSCDQDLAALFDALFARYRGLGDTTAEALDRAEARIRSVEATMAGLGRVWFLGRPRPDLLPGLRQLAADWAVFAYLVDEPARQVRILAVLCGGPSPLAALLRAGGQGC
jgi:plasmid stabilization system protein ParE